MSFHWINKEGQDKQGGLLGWPHDLSGCQDSTWQLALGPLPVSLVYVDISGEAKVRDFALPASGEKHIAGCQVPVHQLRTVVQCTVREYFTKVKF